MKRTDDISNLFNRFGASSDSYIEFGSHFEYKEKPLALVPAATEREPVVEVDQAVLQHGDQTHADSPPGVEAPLALVNTPAPTASLRHLLAEVALARQAEAQARNNEEALRQALPQGRPAKTRAHVIALVSAKGGVGKSTLASALATALRLEGGQTLAIDLDPQNALQYHLGAEPGVAGLGYAGLKGRNWKSLLLAGSAGSLLLPYGSVTEDEHLTHEHSLENDRYWLARQLASMDLSENDVVVLDTPPGRTAYLAQALMVADQVLVVVTADAACFVTLDEMEHLLAERGALGHAQLCNYVINQFDSSRLFCNDMHEVLKRRLGSSLLGVVTLDHTVGEALAYGRNPLLTAESSQACHDMLMLSDRLKAQLKSMEAAES